MPYYCTVPRCTSMAGKAKNVSFHQFPRDEELAKLWNKILKRGKPYTKYSKVCSLHFKPEDYTITSVGKNKGQWRTLRKDAIPSQNLPPESPTPYQRKQWTSWTPNTAPTNVLDSTIQQQMAQAIYMQTMLAMQAAGAVDINTIQTNGSPQPQTSNENKTKMNIETSTSYKCDECSKCFKDPDVFILHKRSHKKNEKENLNLNVTLQANPILANLLKNTTDSPNVYENNVVMENLLMTALAANMEGYLRSISMMKNQNQMNRDRISVDRDQISDKLSEPSDHVSVHSDQVSVQSDQISVQSDQISVQSDQASVQSDQASDHPDQINDSDSNADHNNDFTVSEVPNENSCKFSIKNNKSDFGQNSKADIVKEKLVNGRKSINDIVSVKNLSNDKFESKICVNYSFNDGTVSKKPSNGKLKSVDDILMDKIRNNSISNGGNRINDIFNREKHIFPPCEEQNRVNDSSNSENPSKYIPNGENRINGIDLSQINGENRIHGIALSQINGENRINGIALSQINGKNQINDIALSRINGKNQINDTNFDEIVSTNESHTNCDNNESIETDRLVIDENL